MEKGSIPLDITNFKPIEMDVSNFVPWTIDLKGFVLRTIDTNFTPRQLDDIVPAQALYVEPAERWPWYNEEDELR
jgi:hypothetical protein